MAKKHPGRTGRPPGPPERLKDVRFSLRLHPDLYAALADLADRHGLNRSVAVQHILVSAVNASVGYDLLNLHGQRRDTEKPVVTGMQLLRGLESPRGLPPKKR
jgi:hypothetical protein